MSELTVNWAESDKAYAKGQQAYIEFGQALAKINATQEAIADRYDMSQGSIAKLLVVGADSRIIRITNKLLPRSTEALYLLTTLDDVAFEELAKPDTTQAKILEHKRRLKAPEPVTTPPLSFGKVMQAEAEVIRKENPGATVFVKEVEEPVVRESTGRPSSSYFKDDDEPGNWDNEPVDNSWREAIRMGEDNPRKSIIPKGPGMGVAEAERVMQILPMSKEVLQAIYRYLSSVHHPDKGGDTETMSKINQAYEVLKNEL